MREDRYGTLEKEIVVPTLWNGYLLDLKVLGLGVGAIR